MADIELVHIEKKYPGCTVPAVDDLCLSIAKGEIISLLGPSGCGKTTTLRLIAGFESPDHGAVRFNGVDMVGTPPERRNIGMVFQDYALFPHLDVEGNIGFGLRPSGKAKQRIAGMIEMVGLDGFQSKMPGQLSGGQQGRVALARALVRDPVVVLLDEPFASLDADLREKMQQEVTAIIRRAGATAVFVTHDQREAMTVSDRIAVMKDGRLEQVGSARDVYQRPETRFVATFVGKSNLLTGIMAADGSSIETDLGRIPCSHTHGRAAGQPVMFCIRPCGFERSARGRIRGTLAKSIYTGENTDAVLRVNLPDGGWRDLMVHLHPEDTVTQGQEVGFDVIPYFVAVVVDTKAISDVTPVGNEKKSQGPHMGTP